jgi:hypothetical protein
MKMKKLTIVAAVACLLCLAVPAAAENTFKYRGDIDPSGRIAFKLLKGGGVQKIDALKWHHVPVDCKGKQRTTSNRLGFKVRVKEKAFEATAILGDADDPDATVEINGTLGKGKASGWIRVKGQALPLDGGLTGKCRSGKLDWEAIR